MITFKPKKYLEKNLMEQVIAYLDKKDLRPNLISAKDADNTSKVNSRSMVINKFIQTEDGKYQIQVQDKEGYAYTEKLFKDYFKMDIVDIDKKSRKLTAETIYLGRALDAVEVLARKYKLLSVVAYD